MIVDELVAVLGFDLKGEENLRQFKQGMENAEHAARGFADSMARFAALAVGALAGLAIGDKIGGFIGDVTQTGRTFENLEVRLKSLEGSSEGAKKAMAWISDFAVKTPLELEGVVDAYANLRTFGIDPMSGALQAATDAMAATGGGTEKLNGIILGLGQAWAKGKLQGEEALQLLERGIPVWDLLSKITGKSAEEVQNLSSKGKLGRKEIGLLIDAIGKKYAGASEDMAHTFDGIVGNLKDSWTRFLRTIADAGYYDQVKLRLQRLLDFVNDGFSRGTFDRIAQNISRGLVRAMDGADYVGRRVRQIGGGFLFAADAVASLTSRITGFSKEWAAAGLGVGALAASAVGRSLMLAIAKRVPAIAAMAIGDDLLGYIRGEGSVFGSDPSRVAAFESLKKSFADLQSSGMAAFTAIGGAATGLWNSLDTTGERAKSLSDVFDQMIAKAKEAGGLTPDQGQAFEDQFSAYTGQLQTLADFMKKAFTDPISAAEDLLTPTMALWTAIAGSVAKVMDAVKMAADGAAALFGGESKAAENNRPIETTGSAPSAILSGVRFDRLAGLDREGRVQAEGLASQYGFDPDAFAAKVGGLAKATLDISQWLAPANIAKAAMADLAVGVQARATLNVDDILAKVEMAKQAMSSLNGMVGGASLGRSAVAPRALVTASPGDR